MTAAHELHLVTDNEAAVRPSPSIIDRLDILARRDGGMVEAMVPVELINREDVPVDEAHVEELAASIALEAAKGKGTGQLSAVLLAEVPGRDRLEIADGFHRDAAIYRVGSETVFASVRPNTSEDELLDLRILTANTHSAVAFARTTEWINVAWKSTPWGDKVSAAQAVSLTVTRGSGRGLGLTREEVVDINAWVRDKCEKWRMSASTVNQSMATAEVADPELVNAARRRVGGHSLEGVTPQHLGVIAKGFPHRYAEQHLIAGIALANNMNIPLTRAVVEKLKDIRDFEDMERVAAATDWSQLEPKLSKPRTDKATASTIPRPEAPVAITETASIVPATGVVRRQLLTEIQLGRALLDAEVYRGRYMPPVTHEPAAVSLSVNIAALGDVEKYLLRTVEADETTASFYRATEKVEAPMTRSLIEKYGQSPKRAQELLRFASARILHDLEFGDLRLAGLVGPIAEAVQIDLLRRTAADELHRQRRQALSQSGAPRTGTEYVADIADVIKRWPEMSESLRRVVVFSGVIGMSEAATMRFAGINQNALPVYLRDMNELIRDPN